MYKRVVVLGLALGLSTIFMAGCGSSSSSSPTSGPAPLAITVGDVPLCGVLSFRTIVNGLTLSGPNGANAAAILSSNNTVPLDFAALQDTSTVLDITTVIPGTFTSGSITLISPALAIFDPTESPPISLITASFKTETISFAINPPLVVPNCPLNSTTACKAAALQIDFNLAQSIPLNGQGQIAVTGSGTSQTLVVNSAITGTPLTASTNQGFGVMDDVKGFILSVNNTATSSGNSNFIGSFVLQTETGIEASSALTGAGPDITVELPSASVLVGVTGLNQLTTGNFTEVNGYVDAYGNFVANSAVVEDQENVAQDFATFIGDVVSVTKDTNGNLTSFEMAVNDQEPNTESSATTGNPILNDIPPLIVSVNSSTGYHVAAPLANFANFLPDPSDIAVGQVIEAHATYVPPSSTTSTQPNTSTASDIYFPLQTVSGNYSSLLADGTDNETGGFVFTPCSGFYQGQPFYVITNGPAGNGQFPSTQFVNVNGLAGLTQAPQLLIRGLLYFDQAGGNVSGIQIPANSYVMLAEKVHQM